MARSLRGGVVVSATTGCLRRGGESHGVEDPRHLAPPPSGEPETGGGTAGRVSRTHTREPARRPRRGGSSGKGRLGRQTAVQSPEPCARPESQSPQRQTPEETVSAPIWWQKRPISGEKNHGARQRAPCTHRGGGPQDLGPSTCPQHFPIHTSPGALGAIWSTRGAWRQSGGGARGADKRGRGQRASERARERGSERAGVALPVSPARAGTGPSESPGQDLVKEKEVSPSAASDERAPRGTAPGPRPPYPGHPGRLGPVPTPIPTPTPTPTPTPAGIPRGGGGGGGG